MKNKHFERRRLAAKRYKKTRNTNGDVQGVTTYHLYDTPKELSYWDDFAFTLGSQRVLVTWIHPRMAFQNAIEAEAYKAVLEAIGPGPEWDLFGDSKPVTKKVGKSRKKPIGFTCLLPPVDFKAYREKIHAETARLLKESIFLAKSSIEVFQTHRGRNVNITYPVELRNEAEIIAFANQLKSHLKGEINLFAGLEDYSYSASDWQQEHKEQ